MSIARYEFYDNIGSMYELCSYYDSGFIMNELCSYISYMTFIMIPKNRHHIFEEEKRRKNCVLLHFVAHFAQPRTIDIL